MADQTKYLDRPIPSISLANFDSRIDEITEALVSAAEDAGFFSIVDHSIPSSVIDSMFTQSERFFSLPDPVKAQVPFNSAVNAGWEKNSQVRPSTGAADRKESYQMQFGANMAGKWLSESSIPGFQPVALDFMHACQSVSEQLMTCFARGLGFPDDYFIRAHDVRRPESQTVARLLHYFETPEEAGGEVWHRAGAHTDWDLVTLLFQREGQSGLEICPGREASTTFGHGDTWTKIPTPSRSKSGASIPIICNIGDLLMSWSDDRFKSTFHRVKAPSDPETDFYGERYSIAFFNQPCRDCEIQGPLKKYPMITGEEFTRQAMQKNFSALEEKRRMLAEEEKKKNGEFAQNGSGLVSVGA